MYERAFQIVAGELRDDNLVCIFPEGRLTADGEIREFRPGMMRILNETPVPVVPMALTGLWDSMFSRKYPTFWQRWPRRFWPKVGLSVASRSRPSRRRWSRCVTRCRTEGRDPLGSEVAAAQFAQIRNTKSSLPSSLERVLQSTFVIVADAASDPAFHQSRLACDDEPRARPCISFRRVQASDGSPRPRTTVRDKSRPVTSAPVIRGTVKRFTVAQTQLETMSNSSAVATRAASRFRGRRESFYGGFDNNIPVVDDPESDFRRESLRCLRSPSRRTRQERETAARSFASGKDAAFTLANTLRAREAAITALPSRHHNGTYDMRCAERNRSCALGKATSVRARPNRTHDAFTSDDGQESECCERMDAQEQPRQGERRGLAACGPDRARAVTLCRKLSRTVVRIREDDGIFPEWLTK